MASQSEQDPGHFHRGFERWAGRVRRRLLLRRVLTGLALGLALGAAIALAFWWQRLGHLRPWAAVAGVVGMGVAALIAFRRRWTDSDVALYLDARLGSSEAISTAVELRGQAERADLAREVVVRDAAKALADGDPKRLRPRVLEPLHGLGPVAGAAVAWLSLIPLPPTPPAPPPPPGAEMVQIANLQGLDKIEALANLDPRDAAQKERLEDIARDAKKLREQLAKGMEKREAQAKIAKLRDAVAAERQRFSDSKNRPGLEAAVGKLAKNPLTKDAAKALGNGDLVQFDREMQKLANLAEKESREEAKKALEEAEKAAREKGAEGLAKSLEEQKKKFEERESKGEALRELAKQLQSQGKLSKEAQEDLEEFGQSGSPEAQKRLAESLEKALEGLSDEERKKLAENLKKQIEKQQKDGAGANPMTKEQLEELAKRLGSPQGQKELEQQLKELAKQDPSGDANREKGLDDADRGGAEAEKGLGGMVPMPTPGPGAPGEQNGGKPGGESDGDGKGGPGSKHDKGVGKHDGKTEELRAKELRSKAQAKINPGAPMHGATQGRAPARAGETANQAGTGALGAAGPDQVGGVEHSEVPEEYREQVGRYFQP